MKLVIASKNNNKIKEIKNKFSNIPDLELLSLNNFNSPPDIIEDGLTFNENAFKKAKGISEFTGFSTLADDSGLMVNALGGKPGIYSARYGGENLSDKDRCKLLIDEMKQIKTADRNAKFVCSIVIYLTDGTYYSANGECNGVITDSLIGDYGFGYDPIFYLPDKKKTMAEITMEEKNKLSHRAIALEKARDILIKNN